MNLDEARTLARTLDHLENHAPHISPSWIKVHVGLLSIAAATINELVARLDGTT